MSTQTRSCIICGSDEGLEAHHLAFREHLPGVTVPVCREHHFRLHELLRRYGVMPRAATPEEWAQVLWAFVCGFGLALSTWEEAVGAMPLARKSEHLLGDVARLAATLDCEQTRLGPSPVDNSAAETRAAVLDRRRSGRRQQGDAQAQAPEAFAFDFTGALASAVEELLGNAAGHAEFVRFVRTIASGTDNLVQAIPHIESHPRVKELELLRAHDERVLAELPRCLLRLVRTEIKGAELSPADIGLLQRFGSMERRWTELLSGLAVGCSPAETHRLIDGLLASSNAS